MAWNKDSYYYQNQMKVLSGSDPIPGYNEDDKTTPPSEDQINERVNKNGLYKFVSLIKAKFTQLRDNNWSLVDRNKNISQLADDKDLNYYDGENTYYPGSNKGTKDTIGNFYHPRNVGVLNTPETRSELNYPAYINADNYSTVVKVSAPGGSGKRSSFTDGKKQFFARQDLLQNMNPNRYVRLHTGSGHESGVPKFDGNGWTPWYVFVPMTEDEAFKIGLIDEHGTPQPWRDIFLRRKNDYTNGPIGFGTDPSGDEADNSMNIKAKIVLGQYSYGTKKPSEHYDPEDVIPKGQIYLQYDNNSTEP